MEASASSQTPIQTYKVRSSVSMITGQSTRGRELQKARFQNRGVAMQRFTPPTVVSKWMLLPYRNGLYPDYETGSALPQIRSNEKW